MGSTCLICAAARLVVAFLVWTMMGCSTVRGLDCPSGYTVTSGRCYRLSNQPLSWSAAQTDCQRSGGHLVTVDDETTQNATVRLAGIDPTVDKIWIGLNKTRTGWRYVSVSQDSNIQPQGCYSTDYISGEQFEVLVARGDTSTPATCMQQCANSTNGGYKYAGLIYRNITREIECRCGNKFVPDYSQVIPCTFRCPADQTYYCGVDFSAINKPVSLLVFMLRNVRSSFDGWERRQPNNNDIYIYNKEYQSCLSLDLSVLPKYGWNDENCADTTYSWSGNWLSYGHLCGYYDVNDEATCVQRSGRQFVSGRCLSVHANSGLTWFNARRQCQLNSGDLLRVDTADLLNAINGSYVQSPTRWWIDGINERWSWTDGRELSGYSNWKASSPYNENNMCVSLVRSNSWQWVDTNCNQTAAYICEADSMSLSTTSIAQNVSGPTTTSSYAPVVVSTTTITRTAVAAGSSSSPSATATATSSTASSSTSTASTSTANADAAKSSYTSLSSSSPTPPATIISGSTLSGLTSSASSTPTTTVLPPGVSTQTSASVPGSQPSSSSTTTTTVLPPGASTSASASALGSPSSSSSTTTTTVLRPGVSMSTSASAPGSPSSSSSTTTTTVLPPSVSMRTTPTFSKSSETTSIPGSILSDTTPSSTTVPPSLTSRTTISVSNGASLSSSSRSIQNNVSSSTISLKADASSTTSTTVAPGISSTGSGSQNTASLPSTSRSSQIVLSSSTTSVSASTSTTTVPGVNTPSKSSSTINGISASTTSLPDGVTGNSISASSTIANNGVSTSTVSLPVGITGSSISASSSTSSARSPSGSTTSSVVSHLSTLSGDASVAAASDTSASSSSQPTISWMPPSTRGPFDRPDGSNDSDRTLSRVTYRQTPGPGVPSTTWFNEGENMTADYEQWLGESEEDEDNITGLVISIIFTAIVMLITTIRMLIACCDRTTREDER